MFVCCECCVLSGIGLCDELITRPEESYRLWCVVVCDLETSWMRRPWPALVPQHHRRENVLVASRTHGPRYLSCMSLTIILHMTLIVIVLLSKYLSLHIWFSLVTLGSFHIIVKLCRTSVIYWHSSSQYCLTWKKQTSIWTAGKI